MRKKHPLVLLLTAAAGAAVLFSAALFMKKSSEVFDRQHPELENPLQSEFPSSAQEPETASGITSESGAPAAPVSSLSPQPFPEAETETEMPEEDRVLPQHRIIFTGDSRTLGMQNALGKLMPDDDCVFVGKVGEGYSWFLAEGQALMADAIARYPDAPVVLNFGVNDPDQISQYLDAYSDMIRNFPDTKFYFMSVNPVQREKMIENGASEEALELVTNPNITRLNDAIRNACPDTYLDSSTMLKTTGFETVDGLHFSQQTYLKIHRFAVEKLFG